MTQLVIEWAHYANHNGEKWKRKYIFPLRGSAAGPLWSQCRVEMTYLAAGQAIL